MTPSLEIGNGNWAVQSDSLLGYKTINGKYYPREMSVTRATTGTRVNADGLVELVPYNLLTYSEQFDNSDWREEYVTLTPNTTTAPNGTLTADTLTANSGNSYLYQQFSAVANTTYTFSCYVKTSNISTTLDIALVNQSGASGIANVSFTTTNNWTRVSVTGLSLTTQNAWVAFGTGGTFITGQQLYIWGAQLVEGTNALDYLPTTTRLNIARIDYSTGSPALLVEPQRTNLLDWSEDFTNVVWTKNAGVSVTSDSSISPSGVQNADTIVGATGPFVWGGAGTFVRGVGSLSSSTPYTFSVYLKGSGSVTITCRDGGTGFTNNVVCALTSSWQRFEISRTTAAASTQLAYIFSDASGNFDIWGAQLEAGNYSTSYIPTTSASVTRNADVISKTGISSLIGQTEGSVFVDINIDSSFAEADMRFINVGDGTAANWYFIGTNEANQIRFYYRTSNTAYVSFTTTLTNGRHKLAYAYANGDYVAYVDGTLVHSDNTIVVGSASQLNIANDYGSFSPSKQIINAAALWKERLTNTQLAQITTL
jgi:hypothetical protein